MLEDRTTPTPVITIVKGADAYEGVSNGSFILSRTDDPNFPLSQSLLVNVALQGSSTATPGQDYQFISSQVTFAAGSATASVTVNVIGSPYDDSSVESDETVILNIAGPGQNYTVGDPSSATVIIVDNDTASNNYYWVGDQGTSWSTVGNWALDPMGQTRASDVPHGFRDNVYFDGRTGAYPSVGAGGYSGYNSLHMVNGYSSTLELSSVSFNIFEQTTGTIDQPTASTNLIVTQSFNWTGGILNSLRNGATVTTEGAGTITIPAAGLITGSNLNFLNPSAAAVETVISGAGTLVQNGGTGIYVGTSAGVRVLTSPNAAAGIDGANKTLTLDFGSYWGHEGSGTAPMSHRVINQGGRFYLSGQVTLNMTGGDAFTPAYTQSSGSFLSPSKLEIQSGCILDVSANKGAQINGGWVWLTGNSALAADQQVSYIRGRFAMTGGDIGFLVTVHGANSLKTRAFTACGGVFQPLNVPRCEKVP